MTQPPQRRLRIILAGYGIMVFRVLEALCALPEQCEVVGVFQWRHRRKPNLPWRQAATDWLGQQQWDDFRLSALIQKERLWDIRNLSGLNDPRFLETAVHRTQADIVLVASWGEIVSTETLERCAPCQLINIHPSLLPAHRGPNPYVSCIQEGELQSGVTFHRMEAGIDEGPIIHQLEIPVLSTDTGGILRDRAAQAAQDALPLALDKLSRGHDFVPQPQDRAKASYFPQAYVNAVDLDFRRSADFLERQVRARQPWTPCLAYLNGRFPVAVGRLTRQSLRPTPPSPVWSNVPAGTILQTHHDEVLIASALAQEAILLGQLQLYSPVGYLPISVSRWLLNCGLKPGQHFSPGWSHPW